MGTQLEFKRNTFESISAPEISEEMIERCTISNDYREILFEYYKFVGQIVVICSCLLHESPAWCGRARRLWEVCASSFERIKGLMSANLEFFQDDRYIEATQIIDRCIFETAAKVSWLALDSTDERLQRFLEGSIKPDREHRDRITSNINSRNEEVLVIERRMLDRMRRFEALAGTSGRPSKELRRMPDLSTILSEIGHSRSAYVAVGKVGSHAVHGNWQQLLSRHLVEKDGVLSVEHRPVRSDPAQYAFISLFVLEACDTYIYNCFPYDKEFVKFFSDLILNTQSRIRFWNRKAIGGDLDIL